MKPYFSRLKSFLKKMAAPEKGENHYTKKNNFQSSGQHLFCRGKKEFQEIKGDKNL
jgi:hypothetical protein